MKESHLITKGNMTADSSHKVAVAEYNAAYAKRVSGELTDAEWKSAQYRMMQANSAFDAELRRTETAHRMGQRYCPHCGQPDCKFLFDF